MKTHLNYLVLFFFSNLGNINAQVQMNFKFETLNNEAVGKHVEINSTKIYYEEYGTANRCY
jgi:hypothetical protein